MAQDSFFSKLFAFKFQWIAKLFHNSHKAFLQTAIDITNVVKTAVNSKLVDLFTAIIPGNVDNSIAAILRDEVPKILADELLIQAVGAPATEADAQALAQKLIDAFGSLSDVNKEKFFTSVAAKIYIFLQAHDSGEKVTFGEAATLAESFYQEWLADQAA